MDLAHMDDGSELGLHARSKRARHLPGWVLNPQPEVQHVGHPSPAGAGAGSAASNLPAATQSHGQTLELLLRAAAQGTGPLSPDLSAMHQRGPEPVAVARLLEADAATATASALADSAVKNQPLALPAASRQYPVLPQAASAAAAAAALQMQLDGSLQMQQQQQWAAYSTNSSKKHPPDPDQQQQQQQRRRAGPVNQWRPGMALMTPQVTPFALAAAQQQHNQQLVAALQQKQIALQQLQQQQQSRTLTQPFPGASMGLLPAQLLLSSHSQQAAGPKAAGAGVGGLLGIPPHFLHQISGAIGQQLAAPAPSQQQQQQQIPVPANLSTSLAARPGDTPTCDAAGLQEGLAVISNVAVQGEPNTAAPGLVGAAAATSTAVGQVTPGAASTGAAGTGSEAAPSWLKLLNCTVADSGSSLALELLLAGQLYTGQLSRVAPAAGASSSQQAAVVTAAAPAHAAADVVAGRLAEQGQQQQQLTVADTDVIALLKAMQRRQGKCALCALPFAQEQRCSTAAASAAPAAAAAAIPCGTPGADTTACTCVAAASAQQLEGEPARAPAAAGFQAVQLVAEAQQLTLCKQEAELVTRPSQVQQMSARIDQHVLQQQQEQREQQPVQQSEPLQQSEPSPKDNHLQEVQQQQQQQQQQIVLQSLGRPVGIELGDECCLLVHRACAEWTAQTAETQQQQQKQHSRLQQEPTHLQSQQQQQQPVEPLLAQQLVAGLLCYCAGCQQLGATVVCAAAGCSDRFHVPCAPGLLEAAISEQVGTWRCQEHAATAVHKTHPLATAAAAAPADGSSQPQPMSPLPPQQEQLQQVASLDQPRQEPAAAAAAACATAMASPEPQPQKAIGISPSPSFAAALVLQQMRSSRGYDVLLVNPEDPSTDLTSAHGGTDGLLETSDAAAAAAGSHTDGGVGSMQPPHRLAAPAAGTGDRGRAGQQGTSPRHLLQVLGPPDESGNLHAATAGAARGSTADDTGVSRAILPLFVSSQPQRPVETGKISQTGSLAALGLSYPPAAALERCDPAGLYNSTAEAARQYHLLQQQQKQTPYALLHNTTAASSCAAPSLLLQRLQEQSSRTPLQWQSQQQQQQQEAAAAAAVRRSPRSTTGRPPLPAPAAAAAAGGPGVVSTHGRGARNTLQLISAFALAQQQQEEQQHQLAASNAAAAAAAVSGPTVVVHRVRAKKGGVSAGSTQAH